VQVAHYVSWLKANDASNVIIRSLSLKSVMDCANIMQSAIFKDAKKILAVKKMQKPFFIPIFATDNAKM
jgi:hypothetical protein